ncbi:MAG: M42 family peptidase [Ruminococcus sp.]|nr:M42 family peptidase [Ruminococcus sp.]
MDITEAIIRLSETSGASGAEVGAAETALEMLREYCPDAYISKGNVIGIFPAAGENMPFVLLDAHIDQVGMIVTSVTDDGFVKFAGLGGLDERLLPAQPVVIHGKTDIRGVICSVPPHLSGDGDTVPDIASSAIDTGMTKDELEAAVAPGDAVTYDVRCRRLHGSRLTGRALDDRCGVAAILYAVSLLRENAPECGYGVVFSVQEELGERGARLAAYSLKPDIAIAVDVSFGLAPGEKAEKCGILGKGPMIGISPCLSREVSQGLFSAAKSLGIPYQTEVMEGLTSTNADQYSVGGTGAKACTLSIPLRNMHTPVEVIDTADVELTGRLLAEYIRMVKEGD